MDELQTIAFDDFGGGLDTSTARGKVALSAARSLTNLKLDYTGRLTLVNDHLQKIALNSLVWSIQASGVRRFTRYYAINVDSTSKRYLVFTNRPLLVGPVYYYSICTYAEANGAIVEIGLIQAILAANILDDVVPYYIMDDVQFALFFKTLIFAIPTVGLLVWYGVNTAGTVDICGMNTPYISPTAVLTGTPGNINIASNSPIQYIEYKYTFVSVNGIEGNPSPVSLKVVPSDEQINVKIPNTLLTLESGGVSACTKCVTANIYRRGAAITDNWYKVGSIGVTGGGSGGFYTYTDNIADIDVSTIQVSNNRFMSPAYMDIVLYHNRRLYAASTWGIATTSTNVKNLSTRLFFSGLDNPECWGQLLDNDIEGVFGGYLDMPGLMDDGIVTLATTGNILIIGRKKTIYALYGNSYDNFSISLRASTGVINRRCMCSGHNLVFFWGSNRRVYQVTDDGIAWISQSIQKDLDAMRLIASADDDIKNAYMRYFDGCVYLFFQAVTTSNPQGVCYVYDIVNKAWRKETDMLSYDACVSSSFDQSMGTTYGTNHSIAEEQMLFTDSVNVKLAYGSPVGNAGKFAEYISPEIALLGPAGFCEIRPQRAQMEGTLTIGSSVIAPDLPSAIIRKETGDELYPIDTAVESNTGYNAIAQLLYDFRPQYLTSRVYSIGITGKFKTLELMRARTAVAKEREVRFE